MFSTRHFGPMCLLVLLPLAACATGLGAPSGDAVAYALAQNLRHEAAEFHATLAISGAPECSYEQNGNKYDQLMQESRELASRLTTIGASPALERAAHTLSRSIAEARASHMLASSTTTDPHGACMAPEAVAANAGALDRALAAIGAALNPEGNR